jgi:hypothetical protein
LYSKGENNGVFGEERHYVTTAGLVGHVALPTSKKKTVVESQTDNSWEEVAKKLGNRGTDGR